MLENEGSGLRKTSHPTPAVKGRDQVCMGAGGFMPSIDGANAISSNHCSSPSEGNLWFFNGEDARRLH